MEDKEETYDELYYAIIEKDNLKIRELMKQRANFEDHYADEGNVMNVAITKAGAEQLAALLEVDDDEQNDKAILKSEKYNLVNEPCNKQDQTPLMKCALSGKTDCLVLLLDYGADVNAKVKGQCLRAIDYALQVDHSVAQTVLSLLKADSLLPARESGRERLRELIRDSEEIKSFFKGRDSLHAKLIERPFDADIKALLDEEPSVYYLNSKGQSALWATAWNYKFETWAYLKYKRAKDTGDEEKGDIKMALDSQRESFNRALAKYYFKVRGTQVMKMVSKSRMLGEDNSSKGMGEVIEGYYRSLNGHEITSALLRILHDEADFEVIFDANSSDVCRMVALPGGKVRGLTEYDQNRVYVGTKLCDGYGKGDMLGTLAHELAHKAMAVVFRNNGKPYGEKDEAQKESFMGVYSLLRDRVWSKDVDDILGKVNTRTYPAGALEQELIVRVPHMVAKYGDDDTDRLTLLEDQFPELLDFYNRWVMPAFQKAISASCTNYRMTVKDLSDFHKCLKPNSDEKICLSSNVMDFREKLYHHNGLGILRVSNMKLGLSHLRAQLERENRSKVGEVWHEPLFLDWQQFKYQWLNVMKALSNRAVGTLVLSWNEEKPPSFCRRKKNCHPSCVYQEIVKDWVEEQKSIVDYDKISENIIVVVNTELPSLKEIEPINYSWSDLSEKTKDLILSRQVFFQGKKTNVRKLVKIATADGNVEDYMSTNLTPHEISHLLEESRLCIGDEPGWSSEEKMYKNVFYHKDYYIQRSFGHRIISKEALDNASTNSDIFFVRNASVKDMARLGVKEESMSIWKPSDAHKRTKIYLSNQSTTLTDAGDVILWCKSQVHPVHFLSFDPPCLVYDWSFGSIENVMDVIMDITQYLYKQNYHPHVGQLQEGDETSDTTRYNSLTEEQFILQEFTEEGGEFPKNINETIKPTLIADSSGTGKSFVMNNMATKLKKKLPHTWVISTNLNYYANSSSGSLLDELKNLKNELDSIKFLFGMASTRRSSLEMILFQTLAKRKGRIIALFDGFDEICPNYKTEMISFLKELSKLATVKICIATRLSEKYDLQKSLNTVAHRLIPFKIKKQKEFLNLYWNASLKNYPFDMKPEKIQSIRDGLTEFSKTNPMVDTEQVVTKLNAILENNTSTPLKHEMIDFENVADTMIKRISSQHKDKERFTETPLHVFMVANVVFDDNFAVAEEWNLSQLYEKFLHIKMKIFDKEKAMSTASVAAGRSAEMAKKSAYKILEKLSANVFIQPAPYICNREEIEDAVRVGLVKDVMGSDQFLHRSFAEFLFAKWMIRKARKKNVTLFWLQKLFFDHTFSGVWWFLEYLLEFQSETKLQFKASALSGEELWRYINACLYVIIAITFPSILQAFVNEFGVEVIKLLLEEKNFPQESAYPYGISGYQWFTYPMKTLAHRPSRHEGRLNAFQLIVNIRCCSGIEDIATDKVGEMTKNILKFIVEYDMADELNQKLKNICWEVFIPQEFFIKISSFHSYLSEIVNFLIGDHLELFKDELKRLLQHETEIWHFMDAKTFMIMDKLASSILRDDEFPKLILKNREFVSLWNRILSYGNLNEIQATWHQLSSKMGCKEREAFLVSGIGTQWENPLHGALCNPNEDVWPFAWDMVTSYLSTDDCKKMLHSAVYPEFSHFSSNSLPHCYQLIEMISGTSYLNERELLDLLIPTNEIPQHKSSLLTYICTSDITRHIFHLHQFERGKLVGVRESVFSHIPPHPYLWSIMYSLFTDFGTVEFSERMTALLHEYDSVVGSVATSPLVNTEEREREKESDAVRFCVVLFCRLLETAVNQMDSRDHVSLLQLPATNQPDLQISSLTELALMMPTVLHIAQTLDSPFVFGVICSILLRTLSNESIEVLLFAVNLIGDTAYHVAARSHRQLMPKLEKLATESIGENGLQQLSQTRNKQGFLAEELVHNADHSMGFTTSYDV